LGLTWLSNPRALDQVVMLELNALKLSDLNTKNIFDIFLKNNIKLLESKSGANILVLYQQRKILKIGYRSQPWEVTSNNLNVLLLESPPQPRG